MSKRGFLVLLGYVVLGATIGASLVAVFYKLFALGVFVDHDG